MLSEANIVQDTIPEVSWTRNINYLQSPFYWHGNMMGFKIKNEGKESFKVENPLSVLKP